MFCFVKINIFSMVISACSAGNLSKWQQHYEVDITYGTCTLVPEKLSATQCTSKCAETTGCQSLNIHRNNHQCELCSVHAMNVSLTSTPRPGWTIIYRVPRKLIVCEEYSGYLECSDGQKLFIYSARYGRPAGSNLCLKLIVTTNCYSHSSDLFVKQKCNGLKTCLVESDNGLYGDPCFGTTKYLEILYVCQ